jgi:hypothetical protein
MRRSSDTVVDPGRLLDLVPELPPADGGSTIVRIAALDTLGNTT